MFDSSASSNTGPAGEANCSRTPGAVTERLEHELPGGAAGVQADIRHYSIDPGAIGRFVDVTANLSNVTAVCDGELAARHERSPESL